jgi:hypothetical protein
MQTAIGLAKEGQPTPIPVTARGGLAKGIEILPIITARLPSQFPCWGLHRGWHCCCNSSSLPPVICSTAAVTLSYEDNVCTYSRASLWCLASTSHCSPQLPAAHQVPPIASEPTRSMPTGAPEQTGTSMSLSRWPGSAAAPASSPCTPWAPAHRSPLGPRNKLVVLFWKTKGGSVYGRNQLSAAAASGSGA